MKKHVKLYLDITGYDVGDVILCEIPTCRGVAVDIHHIEPRGIGGDPSKDVIENLIALCRECHDKAEASDISKEYLRELAEERICGKN